MPFVQRVIEPKYLSRTSLFNEDGNAKVSDEELQAVTNNTLANALRQLASLVLVADDIFTELGNQLQGINKRSEVLKEKIAVVDRKVQEYDPKKVTVPEGDISTFALLTNHYATKQTLETSLFGIETRPAALQALYDSATKTPVHLMRQLDRWRRDGHRSSRFFLCTPVLGAKRRKIRNRVDIDIETRMPAAVEELRRWTSNEALGDITVTTDGCNRIALNSMATDGETTDGTIGSDDEAIDHKLPSPEEQLQVVALKFPAEIVAVDITGRSFDRMSMQRRSLLHGDVSSRVDGDSSTVRRRTRSRKPRGRRRNTLAGTDQKEIRDALTAGEENSSPTFTLETENPATGAVLRSKSSDLLRSKKESPDKKSHFNSLKQWGKTRYDRLMNKSNDSKTTEEDSVNLYETVLEKKKKDLDKERRTHERNSSISSSEKSSSINLPVSTLSSVMNIAVKLRESSIQRRQRRTGGNKEEPHSSSGNWSASSESGRASIASEITTTKSASSLTQPSSGNSRRRFINTSTASSVTSEGTLTPDIIQDLHEDETSSVYSCDTEGYYTSFHMDSGLKTLKEEDLPSTPLHSTSAFSNSGSNSTVLTPENEYELFGKGSTSTTTSSAGTVCTTLRAAESSRSLVIGPAVPERKSSLKNKVEKSPESSLERDFSDKTGTVKRSPNSNKPTVIAVIHKDGDLSPDSGHNTSSSPIESINSPNTGRSGSEFEFSESSDMEGPERIERIRVKTTINSSRIPSMCVITPPHSDDESIKSAKTRRNKMNLPLKPYGASELRSTDADKENLDCQTRFIGGNSKIVVNPHSGYATVETLESEPEGGNANLSKMRAIRAPSPSGGTLTINEMKVDETHGTSALAQPVFKAALLPLHSRVVKDDTQVSRKPDGISSNMKEAFGKTGPTIKSTLLPINSMFDRLKTNLASFADRRKNKSQERVETPRSKSDEDDENVGFDDDAGEYVTIADVRNNNSANLKKYSGDEVASYANCDMRNDSITRNLSTVLSGKNQNAEYVSLNDLPCNKDDSNGGSSIDSLERKRRQGARVTLDAEGKVVYSSDSLRRRKPNQTTFEPGPFVKPSDSPILHRTPKSPRPVTLSHSQRISNVPQTEFHRPLSPQMGKIIIKATTAGQNPTTNEIVRMPPATIVTAKALNPTSRTPESRGAYVHVQDQGGVATTTPDKERVLTKSPPPIQYTAIGPLQDPAPHFSDMYSYHPDPYYEDNRQYFQHYAYNTLPTKKTQYFAQEANPERSVTPDITRGLNKAYQTHTHSIDRRVPIKNVYQTESNQRLGKPVQMPDVPSMNYYNPSYQTNERYYDGTHQGYYEVRQSMPPKQYEEDDVDSFRISPIDPRNLAGFQASTPTSKPTELRAAANLESKLLSPKKSTMSNEQLYAMIHKSKKKMNIDGDISEVKLAEPQPKPVTKSPESGYLPRSRLSWSPSKGEYVDFSQDIDKISPPNDSRTRQSWACSDRKGTQQTSRLDFKRLLLQKSNFLGGGSKKLSAVEQLKLSKEQQPQKPAEPDMSILELSGSPRSLVNRKLVNSTTPGSPKNTAKAAPKLLSPRSQWRFANPRSDVLSSTILEDCREDENSPNSSIEKKDSMKSSDKDNYNKSIQMSSGQNPAKFSTNPNETTAFHPTYQSSYNRGSNRYFSPANNSFNNPNPINQNPIQNKDNIKPYSSSITERLQAQRAQFFNNTGQSSSSTVAFQTPSSLGSQFRSSKEVVTNSQSTTPPTLETAF